MEGLEQELNRAKGLPRSVVVRTALIAESFLAIVAIAWGLLYFPEVLPQPTLSQVGVGLLATLPMLVINIGFFEVLAQGKHYKVYQKFKHEVVVPLCANLNVTSIFLVALSSGIGEELFFRGMLNTQFSYWLSDALGIAIGSFLFAYVHFIGMVRHYWKLLIYYIFFGLYFSIIFYLVKDLTPCIIAHAGYNFCAMCYIRYFDCENTPSSSQ